MMEWNVPGSDNSTASNGMSLSAAFLHSPTAGATMPCGLTLSAADRPIHPAMSLPNSHLLLGRSSAKLHLNDSSHLNGDIHSLMVCISEHRAFQHHSPDQIAAHTRKAWHALLNPT